MNKRVIIRFLFVVFVITALLSCGGEEGVELVVEDGQVSLVFEGSVYIIDNPRVGKTTDISYSGPEVSVITISGSINDANTFTIWVRNYLGEPSDCILEATYFIDEEVSRDKNQCVTTSDNELFCNASFITVS